MNLRELEASLAEAEGILQGRTSDPGSLSCLIARIHRALKGLKELDHQAFSWQVCQGCEVRLRDEGEKMLYRLQRLRQEDFSRFLLSACTGPGP
jgi:hypothetical protein